MIQWGGGSSRIFPWSPGADAIQRGGEGVVAEIFRDLPRSCVVQWGGVVAGFFP